MKAAAGAHTWDEHLSTPVFVEGHCRRIAVMRPEHGTNGSVATAAQRQRLNTTTEVDVDSCLLSSFAVLDHLHFDSRAVGRECIVGHRERAGRRDHRCEQERESPQRDCSRAMERHPRVYELACSAARKCSFAIPAPAAIVHTLLIYYSS
eukprot:COSAG02_NODE_147_length_33939_cov_6.689539_6_plen_150_part_00